ncbi:Uu.00g118810.m01.CDS01 [Anthostomella pinea]|uniref:Uu.00g118810.m01.CDS01 n=1 Tax=Anthostomella pinea TaxID=933095 RepID=A0AAI8YH72_9PEZI|nr:Uu.00g118810.m01.CDS01 [Anthostomella pinea]
MGVLELPVELLVLIAQFLTLRDVASFCRSCHFLCAVVSPNLYFRARNDVDLLCWAAEHDRAATVEKLLKVGVNPNQVQPQPIEEDFHFILVGRGLSHMSAGETQDYSVQLMLLEQENRRRPSAADMSLPHDFLRSQVPHSKSQPKVGPISNCVTALHTASGKGDIAISRFIMHHYKPPVNALDHHGMSPLSWAYREGHGRVMTLLWQNGADLDADADGRGRTLLLDACARGHFAAASDLVKLGVNVNKAFMSDGATLLHYLCGLQDASSRSFSGKIWAPFDLESRLQGNYRLWLLQAAVKAGADINARGTRDGLTPLAAAASSGLFPIVQLLLKYGADTEARNTRNETPLMCAAQVLMTNSQSSDSYLRTLMLLLGHGASTTAVDESNKTALRVLSLSDAPYIHKPAMARLLIAHGSPLHPTDATDSDSFISMTFRYGNFRTSQALHECGARPPSKSNLVNMLKYAVKGNDPPMLRFTLQFHDATRILATPTRLYCALRDNRNNVAKMILDAGAPASYVGNNGWTCLLHACKHQRKFGYGNVVRKLFAAGANPNQSSKRGETPLSLAVDLCNVEIVEMLLDHGANLHDVQTGQEEGVAPRNAFIVGIFSANLETLECLLKRRPLCGTTEAKRAEYMFLACTQNNLYPAQTLRALLGAGLDPKIPLMDHGTLHLNLVVRSRDLERIQVLLDHGADIHRPPADSCQDYSHLLLMAHPTPLQLAIQQTETADDGIVELLLRHQPSTGPPPQELAVSYIQLLCEKYHFHLFKSFFDAGIAPHTRNEDGDVALSVMLRVFGKENKTAHVLHSKLPLLALCIGTLLDLGCDANACNTAGERPVDYMTHLLRPDTSRGKSDNAEFDAAVAHFLSDLFYIHEKHGTICKKEGLWKQLYEKSSVWQRDQPEPPPELHLVASSPGDDAAPPPGGFLHSWQP